MSTLSMQSALFSSMKPMPPISAARLYTAPHPFTAPRQSSRSSRLPCRFSMSSKRWYHSASGFLSTARTSRPWRRRSATKWPPIKPPAPQTRILLIPERFESRRRRATFFARAHRIFPRERSLRRVGKARQRNGRERGGRACYRAASFTYFLLLEGRNGPAGTSGAIGPHVRLKRERGNTPNRGAARPEGLLGGPGGTA